MHTANKKRLTSAISGRPVWLASSTHLGEDEIIATAHVLMKRKLPNLLTIIVPRHPERGPGIAAELRSAALKAALRSEGTLPEKDTDIYVADTIGELGLFYASVPVALIGGSLVARGGQNPVEAIKLGAAVLTGPNWQNFRDSYSELLKAEGAKEVSDATSLAEAALHLLQDEDARETMKARAEAANDAMGGALTLTLEALDSYLPPKVTLKHAS